MKYQMKSAKHIKFMYKVSFTAEGVCMYEEGCLCRGRGVYIGGGVCM